MQDYRKLRVWEASQSLAVKVHQITSGFPASERFGLRAQLRNAANSVPANIAEGCGRRGRTELSYFLQVAIGSVFELSSHIDLARRLGLLDPDSAAMLAGETDQVRRSLIKLQTKVDSQRCD